ncbi:MAG: ECF transporter S component [Dehalococcoidales bacterium]
MSNSAAQQIWSRVIVFPYVLKFTDTRLYIFVTAFIALDVAIPWALHLIHPLAGATFLPMFFFTLLAGLLFGWRAGLMVGFLTPLVSFAVSGMPFLSRLPQIVVENSVFGLSAGLLYGGFRLNLIWSLLGAMVLGRLALMLAVLVIHFGEVNPALWVWQTIQQGWPGIAIQLVCLPLIVSGLNNWFAKRNGEKVK